MAATYFNCSYALTSPASHVKLMAFNEQWESAARWPFQVCVCVCQV